MVFEVDEVIVRLAAARVVPTTFGMIDGEATCLWPTVWVVVAADEP
jgi:hypothetical protein